MCSTPATPRHGLNFAMHCVALGRTSELRGHPPPAAVWRLQLPDGQSAAHCLRFTPEASVRDKTWNTMAT